MHDDLEPTQPLEHALARPELSAFVAAARAQTIVGTCVTAESVQAGLEYSRRRSHAQRMLWLSVPVAVTASLLVMVMLSPLWSRDGGEQVANVEAGDAVGEQLATGVRMSSTGVPEVRDAWTVVLGEGTHEVELVREPGLASQPLHIELPGRTLELIEGSATIEVVGHDAAVRLHNGVAAWVGADGQRTHIEVEQLEIATDDAPSEAESAAVLALAREADRLLAAGEQELAIATLRQLVETYPNASQTRAAVLDLARLLDGAGRESEARCAYEMHLDRWPDSSITAEVEAQLARLGKTECSGLQPR
jgi:hypothetical protein